MERLSLREVQLMQLELMRQIDRICKKHNIIYYVIAGSCLGAVRHRGFIPWDDDIDIAMMRSEYERFAKIFDEEFDTEKYFLQNYDSDKKFIPALSRICIKGTFVDLKCEKHHKTCKNTYVDLFPLDNIPDEAEQRKKHKIRIKILRRLIAIKQYRLYRDSILEFIIKWAVSAILSIIPLRYVQKALVKEMSRYSTIATTHVCSIASGYSYDRQSIDRRIYGTPTRVQFEGVELNAPEYKEEYLRLLYGDDYMQIPPESKRVVPPSVYIIERK